MREYYECLKSLFMLVYQAGQMIASNLFTLRRDTLGLGRMQFVSVVLD